MKQKTTWKSLEREMAKRLNGTRTGPTGRDSADVVTEHYSIECKLRDELPGWMKRAMAQAHDNAVPGTLPVLLLHESGQRHDGDLVVMRLETFTRLEPEERVKSVNELEPLEALEAIGRLMKGAVLIDDQD